jgi:hypothetical protein
MAKIKTLKLELKEKEYKINVNCTSAGVFTANIPREISEALGINSRVELSTLGELEREIYDVFHKYKTSTTTEELFLAIKYGALGTFNKKSDGYPLYGRDKKDKFGVDGSFMKNDNILVFEYRVLLKLTVDGKVSWYNTNYGYEGMHPKEGEEKQYRKRSVTWSVDNYVLVSYSEEAKATLVEIEEVIRQASETLFNFVSLDEDKVQAFLESGNIKLLN